VNKRNLERHVKKSDALVAAVQVMMSTIQELRQRVEALELSTTGTSWTPTYEEVVERMECTGYNWEKSEAELVREYEEENRV